MISIISTLLLCMISVGHGNPVPEPNPEPNLIIQVRQEVHGRYCKKPHDDEGPHGHPMTVATPVDVDALEAEKQAVDDAIAQAEADLLKADEDAAALAAEVANAEAEVGAINDLLAGLGDLFAVSRRKRSLTDKFYDTMGGLGNVFGDSHRSRRAVSSSVVQTVSYCPTGVADITDTGFNLYGKALTDVSAALAAPRDIPLAVCLLGVLNGLKAQGISLTAAEIQTLKAQADAAKNKAETAKQEKEAALVAKRAEAEAAKAAAEALTAEIAEKKAEAAAIEAQIETANENNPEPTDAPGTTIETTITTQEVAENRAVEFLATTEPTDEVNQRAY